MGLGFPGTVAQVSKAVGLVGEVQFPVTARSRSGYLVVRGQAGSRLGPGSAGLLVPTSPGQFVRIPKSDVSEQIVVSPALIAVSGERVREGLIRLLGLSDGHHGRVVVVINPAWPKSAPLKIESNPFSDGWQYTIVVPDQIEWPRWVRAMTEVVLLDQANPDPRKDLASIPLWLSEGATQLLISSSGRELVPEPNREFKDLGRHFDPLPVILARLEGHSPLDFAALSFPSETTLSDVSQFAVYQASAALLVHELPRKPGHADSISSFVRRLQSHLNWQSAMLQAWSGRFHSLLEVEKWWAVQSSFRQLRNPSKLWSKDATLAQLRSILLESVALGGTNQTTAGPSASTLPLSQVVLNWEFSAQTEVLERKLTQLANLFPLSDPELVPLIQEIHQTLSEYRSARANPLVAHRGELDPRYRVVARTAASGLKRLETRIFAPQ